VIHLVVRQLAQATAYLGEQWLREDSHHGEINTILATAIIARFAPELCFAGHERQVLV
jgi:hypothetical protein